MVTSGHVPPDVLLPAGRCTCAIAREGGRSHLAAARFVVTGVRGARAPPPGPQTSGGPMDDATGPAYQARPSRKLPRERNPVETVHCISATTCRGMPPHGCTEPDP